MGTFATAIEPLPPLSQAELDDLYGNMLTANQRLKIAALAAQALEYLHTAAQPPVLHRDVVRYRSKTSSISH
jgi:hypothetical protein